MKRGRKIISSDGHKLTSAESKRRHDDKYASIDAKLE